MSITAEDLAECIRLAEDGDPNVKIEAITSKGTKINAKGEELEIVSTDEGTGFTYHDIELLQIFAQKKDLLDKDSYIVNKITNRNKNNMTLLNPKIYVHCPDNDENIPTQYIMRKGERSRFIERSFTKIKDFDNFKFPYIATNMRPAPRFKSQKYSLSPFQYVGLNEKQQKEYYRQMQGTLETIHIGKTLRPNKPIWIALKANGLEGIDVEGDIKPVKKRRKRQIRIDKKTT